jgi:hypothetical protein
MNTLRIVYHIARADFLERVRRYSFLVMLALVAWLGFLSASGQLRMRVPPDLTGIVNSAWVGGTMTVTVSFLLGWVGFYIVKGSINADYSTGVGQIMAATPLSRQVYLVGKWLSNFTLLAIAVLVMLLEGILMNLLAGIPGFNLAALAAPLLIIALPSVGLIAAFAVLFESIGWLRGGLGNLVYFFAFLFAIVATGQIASVGIPGKTPNPYVDFSGWQIIGDSVSRAARSAYPETTGGFSFSISSLASPKLFLWNGVHWTSLIFLSRLFFLLIALGLVMLSAVFFDRFDPSHLRLVKRKKAVPAPSEPVTPPVPVPLPEAHLTPLPAHPSRFRFRFDALFIAELKLFMKGQRWWWYAVAVALLIAQLFSPPDVNRILLVVSWVWPVLILSNLGSRAHRSDTTQIVFSAPHPIANQVPAEWLSAFVVIALLGAGVLLRFILAGAAFSILGWLTGALFIPSVALVCGVLTGSGKAFEVLYVMWMYLLLQKVALLDFLGLTPAAPLAGYALLALALVAVACFVRQRQLNGR